MVKQIRRVELWKDIRYWGVAFFGSGLLCFIPTVWAEFPGQVVNAIFLMMMAVLFPRSTYNWSRRMLAIGITLLVLTLLLMWVSDQISAATGLSSLALYSVVITPIGGILLLLAIGLKHEAAKQDVVDHSRSKFTLP